MARHATIDHAPLARLSRTIQKKPLQASIEFGESPTEIRNPILAVPENGSRRRAEPPPLAQGCGLRRWPLQPRDRAARPPSASPTAPPAAPNSTRSPAVPPSTPPAPAATAPASPTARPGPIRGLMHAREPLTADPDTIAMCVVRHARGFCCELAMSPQGCFGGRGRPTKRTARTPSDRFTTGRMLPLGTGKTAGFRPDTPRCNAQPCRHRSG
jgi:hypothetical protein